LAADASQFCPRSAVDIEDHRVKSAQTGEAGGQCNLGHRQIGSVEQTFYALHAQCLPHLVNKKSRSFGGGGRREEPYIAWLRRAQCEFPA
jgi:hypothetical protein